MAQTPQPPEGNPKRQRFWQRWHRRVGWIVGLVAPLITPFLPTVATVPQGVYLPFELAGALAGWLGFGTNYYLWSRTKIWRIVLWVVTIAAGAGAIVVRARYEELLWHIATPTNVEEWEMLVLFALSYFGIFFVIAFLYFAGGQFLLEKLMRV